mgnify:CR=1 FL=1
MATKAFQKIYTKISQITKATCSLKATGVGYDELAMVNGNAAAGPAACCIWRVSARTRRDSSCGA